LHSYLQELPAINTHSCVQFYILFYSDKQALHWSWNERHGASEDHRRNREENWMAHNGLFVSQRFWSWGHRDLYSQTRWIWNRSSDHSAFSWVVISDRL